MNDVQHVPRTSEGSGGEVAEDKVDFGFGHGGVPWLLMLFYLAFLVFFAWYVLEYQLPDYLKQGPVVPAAAEEGLPE